MSCRCWPGALHPALARPETDPVAPAAQFMPAKGFVQSVGHRGTGRACLPAIHAAVHNRAEQEPEVRASDPKGQVRKMGLLSTHAR